MHFLPLPQPRAAAPAAFPDDLAALSHALDLTEGQAPGHSMRTCVIGMRFRVALFGGIARGANVTRELIRIRCERGAAVARQLGFPDATGATIAALDEHWNGGRHPLGRRGDEIRCSQGSRT